MKKAWNNLTLKSESYSMNFLNFFFPKQEDPDTLTHKEAQLIRQALIAMDYELEAEVEVYKPYIQQLWLKCDPDNKETIQYFKKLNKAKDNLRKVKAKRKQIAQLLKDLK